MALKLSIRVRLTLWNAGVLAFLLTALAFAGWLTLAYTLKKKADDTIVETAHAVAGAVIAERKNASLQGRSRLGDFEARNALSEVRAGDLDIIVADDAARVIAASRRARQPGRKNKTANVRTNAPSKAAGPTAEVFPDTAHLAQPVRNLLRAASTDSLPAIRTLELDDGVRRAAALRFVPGDSDAEPALVVAVLRATHDDDLLLARARTVLLLAIPVALTVSVLAGYLLARQSLAPVDSMVQRASRISAANLEARLPVANEHDELGRLATVVNALLARVDDAFRRQKLFVAEASHELRTPIAIVRGEADVTLQRSNRSADEYRESLTVIRDESVRLTSIVNDLFLLASADAGAPLPANEYVDIAEMVHNAVRSVRSLADENGVQISLRVGEHDRPPIVIGDYALLRRVVLNLLDNAIKHVPATNNEGRIDIAVHVICESAVVTIADNGPGIPSELRDRVFDRFVRGHHSTKSVYDSQAPVKSSGAGLGLAIAGAIVAVHRGQISLDETETGAAFRVVLPLASSVGMITNLNSARDGKET